MSLFKLVFFVPRTDTRRVLDHLFATLPDTLGVIGNYRQVAFIAPGMGARFLPL